MKLAIECRGHGKPLVLLHGFGFDRTIFYPLVEALESSFQCHLVDLPGFGGSPYQPYTLVSLAAVLKKQLPADAHWVGWSVGGTIALSLALQSPTFISRLTLLAATPCFCARPGWPGMGEEEFAGFAAAIETASERAMGTFLMQQFAQGEVDRSLYKQLKARCNLMVTNRPALNNALMILHQTDLRQEVSALTVPCDMWLGEKDQLVPCTVADELTAQSVNPIILSSIGHLPFLQAKTEIVDHLRNVLRS